MESSLEIGFLRAAEKAAIAAARTMGYGKRKYSDQVAVEAMRAGVVDFIEKPFDVEVLLRSIQMALDTKAGSDILG